MSNADKKTKPKYTPPPLLYSINDARQSLGNICRESVYRLIRAGKLEKVKQGSRSYITAGSMKAHVQSLSDTQHPPSRDAASHEGEKRCP
jgi:hypothetical protein